MQVLGENPNSLVVQTAEFGSIERMGLNAKRGLPGIANYCIRLLLEIARIQITIPEDKRTFTSDYVPVLKMPKGSPPKNSKNPHAVSLDWRHDSACMVQMYNPYTRKQAEFFDPYLQYGGESVYCSITNHVK